MLLDCVITWPGQHRNICSKPSDKIFLAPLWSIPNWNAILNWCDLKFWTTFSRNFKRSSTLYKWNRFFYHLICQPIKWFRSDSISVSITGEITSIRPLANLDPASVALLVPHFNFQFTATGYVSKSQKLPRHLIGQHILVNLNNDDGVKCIFFLYKSMTKYIFYLKVSPFSKMKK